MQFNQIVGQAAIKRRLINTVTENRVSHAQLFLGPEGSGSLALAVAYAQFLSCEDKQADDSCGACSSCRKYQKLMHPDLHFSYPTFGLPKETAIDFIENWRQAFTENPYLTLDIWRSYLDAGNKQANINIAECHQIIKKLSFKPFESVYKVLILWLPEYLDKQGNALLKIIEEPQPNTLFLLVAQNQDQILNTILSRTQLVKIPALTYDDIVEHLKGCTIIKPNMKLAEIAYLSNGNLTEALAMLQQDNKSYHGLFVQWLRLCFANKGIELVAFVDQVSKMGRENQKNFIRYGISFIRECCLLIAGAGSLVHLPAAELETAQKMANIMTISMANAISGELEKAHYHVERNANPKILFLDVSLQIIGFLKPQSVPQGNHHISN